jgi:hypothetical protein
MPKLIGHEIEDFYAELKLNEDDPEWARKLSQIVVDVYEQEKEMAKVAKAGKSGQLQDSPVVLRTPESPEKEERNYDRR